jgi:hypothetical protein
VRLGDGEDLRGRAAILAVDPITACDLLALPAVSPLARWTANSLPIRAACLDQALSMEAHRVRVNGLPGLLTMIEAQILDVLTLNVVDGRIAACFIVRNPDKLARVAVN